MSHLIRIVVTFEPSDGDILTMADASIADDGSVEMLSYIENEEVLVDALYDLAEFIDDNLSDNPRSEKCH